MPSHTQHLWNNEKIGYPPAKKELVLAYQDVEKVQLSFIFDISHAAGSYMDPSKAIRINGRVVQIPDLPQNPLFLSLVEKTEIDVTKMVKTSPTGEKNQVEVNYILSKTAVTKGWLQRHIGTLTLYFTIWYGEKTPQAAQAATSSKFCMHCGRNIPIDSRICPYCGQPIQTGGTNPKPCRNCSRLIPERARYCEACGKEQPAA